MSIPVTIDLYTFLISWKMQPSNDDDIVQSCKSRRPLVLGHVTCDVCAFCLVLSEKLVVLTTPRSSGIICTETSPTFAMVEPYHV